MRREKLQFDRNVGQANDRSWISVSEGNQGYELAVRTRLVGGDDKYTEWNSAEIEDPGYIGDEAITTDNNYSSQDGVRILNPGTSEEFQTPFSLSEESHKGLLGEVQAASVYESVKDHVQNDHVGIYDFIEWFQSEPKSNLDSMLKVGPEYAFAVDGSRLRSSLNKYSGLHAFDGAQLQSGLDGEVVAEIPDTRNDSILRQSGLEAVNGILTQNPEQVREIVGSE